jgi:hypothetical protein
MGVDSRLTYLRALRVRHVRGEARLEAASISLSAEVRLAHEQLAQYRVGDYSKWKLAMLLV